MTVFVLYVIGQDIGILIQRLVMSVQLILIMMIRLKRVHNVQLVNQFGMDLFVLDARPVSTMIRQQRDVCRVPLG